MGTRSRTIHVLGALVVSLLFVTFVLPRAQAFVSQSDGSPIPQTNRLQLCFDAPSGEATPGLLDAIEDAATLPEAFRPVQMANGRYEVTFTHLAEGSVFRNSFGWYWIGDDVTDVNNLRTIFGCRYDDGECPCGGCPVARHRQRTIDFATQPGFSPGRPIGFWLRTQQQLMGGGFLGEEGGAFPPTSSPFCSPQIGCDPPAAAQDDCGARVDTGNRIYFTSSALNDDGDFVHFLVYRGARVPNSYYFGFEDLFRGGDNDYEDALVRAVGLVPVCDPRPETCNNVDDDCDGTVDDGLVMSCGTACGMGTRTCVAGSYGACTARTPAMSETVCDGADEDCDGNVDEGVTRACGSACGPGREVCIAGSWALCDARQPGLETCNRTDDDCDGRTDENLYRTCYSACGSGMEVCSDGRFGACTAAMPGSEDCDGADDDCDGRIDEGLSRDCTNMCGAGTERCAAGTWVGCTAPPQGVEVCNGTDDDCDTQVDENLTRACANMCGVGTETCSMGSWGACDAPTGSVEVCDNLDNDCDGVIDDGNPGGGAACTDLPDGGFTIDDELDAGVADGGLVCSRGRVVCVAGVLECQGGASGSPELCNCLDDDCDGSIDEEAPGSELCPGGACVASECSCADRCSGGEFPCPPGQDCRSDTDGGVLLCLQGLCANVTCGPQEVCNPDNGICRDLCQGAMCPAGFVCQRGACIADNCTSRGCPVGETCRTPAGGGVPVCVRDLCADVSCGENEFCRGGTCVAACVNGCATDERCVDGRCERDPCGGRCPGTQYCMDGECVNAICTGCGLGRLCRGGQCVDDPCHGVVCPMSLECYEGNCSRVIQVGPRDAGPGVIGVLAGGPVFGCSVSAPARPDAPARPGAVVLMVLAAVTLSWVRRRKLGTRAALATLALLALAPSAGCTYTGYCFENCGNQDAGAVDSSAGAQDAGRDAFVARVDGCTGAAVETCNMIDDDCDRLIDNVDPASLETDPGNCGSCGNVCNIPHAFPACVNGTCAIDRCEIGYVNYNQLIGDGCEYACTVTGDELCDGVDNDCDTQIDEPFDLMTDPTNCGRCGVECSFANATSICDAGTCSMTGCRAGYVDLNSMSSDGCEYQCTPTGPEVCDRVDNDCNGPPIDEGFDLMNDPANCGACGRSCAVANATARCVMGSCEFDPMRDCNPGYFDVDRLQSTGCEYMCTRTGGPDLCDGVDQDCDGERDEDEPAMPCGTGPTQAPCRRGTMACVLGMRVCAGEILPGPERCNGSDDDCDGRADESTMSAPIPGVGARCGATDLGRCSYGTYACPMGGGDLVCNGEVGPTTETCNGVDDDCNGVVDDGLTAPPIAGLPSCNPTIGVCGGRTPICRGGMGWSCDPPMSFQMTETRCDMRDNDCDGVQDENCLSPVGNDVRLDTQDNPSQHHSLDATILGSGSGGSTELTVAFRARDNSGFFGGELTRIYGTRSTDNGGAWSMPAPLDLGGPAYGGQIARAVDTTVVVYPRGSGAGGNRQLFARRLMGGALQPEVRINGMVADPSLDMDAYGASIAASGTTVYAAFEAFAPGAIRRRHIYFSRSADRGATWSLSAQLSTPTGNSFIAADARIAVSGTNVYVVWRDNRSGTLDVFFRRSTDGGLSWGPEVRLDSGMSSSFAPEIAARAANVYVAWVDDQAMGAFDIWLNRSTNNGQSFVGARSLEDDPLRHDSIEPRLTTPSDSSVVVAWIDYRDGLPDVRYRRSTDSGANFAASDRIDTGSAAGVSGSFDLEIGSNGSLVAAVWADDRGGLLDIYTNYSLDGGATFQPQDYRLDTSPLGGSDSQNPAVWVGVGSYHVVWQDHRRGSGCPAPGATCRNADIFYRRVQ